MLRIIIITVCVLLTALGSFSQTRNPVKPSPAKTVPTSFVKEIPAAEWDEIIKSLETEDWEKASFLSSESIKKLPIETERRQLARLRYFYLFSLAGKTAQEKMTPVELEKTAQTFVGKDFIMLRKASSNCRNSLNFACPVKETQKALRVTATNKEANIIHSFEYVKLLQEFDFAKNNLKNVFVGGTLEKVEINYEPDNVWMMRLYFKDGWVQTADNK